MTVVITGANRGIGRALYDTYKAAGADILGTTRGPLPGPGWLGLDVTDPGAAEMLRQALAERPVALLICNAGVYTDKGQSPDSGYPAAQWAASFAVNVTGVFVTIQALLPNLRAAGGKIAIIGSKMGSDALAPGGSYIYRASKAAVLNLGRNLAADLAPQGIAVGIYHPGWVRTDMGGDSADIDVAASAAGLAARFATLSAATTGCFEDWDGQALPY